MGTKDDVIEAEHLAAGAKLELHGVLCDPVRILGTDGGLLCHWRGAAPAVHRDRRAEHERRHAGVDRGVQEVDASDDIVRVIEALDEMTETFGSVRGEVIDMLEMAVREHAVDEMMVGNGALDERGGRGNVLEKAAAEIVKNGDAVTAADQSVRHMGADEPGSSSH